MPVWAALAALVGWNYARHRRHRSTLCAVTRRAFHTSTPSGRAAFVISWAGFAAWLMHHILKEKTTWP